MIIGRQIRVRGVVQGVGFRPTVWHLARHCGLTGQIFNDGEGVLIDVWGTEPQLDHFVTSINNKCPPLARIDSIEQVLLNGEAATDFRIIESRQSMTHTAIAADAASCQACSDEIVDSNNLRYRYPFTNCTHCGPRLSIINGVPYDRAKTSMVKFTLCPECQAEYDNPADRRFHAQPNACPVCGPEVWLEPPVKNATAKDDIDIASKLLQQGYILAIKGIGGFHLACNATDADAVARLRERKQRYGKPFALMGRDLENIRQYCKVDNTEAKLLTSVTAPIVLLDIKPNSFQCSAIAPTVAPGISVLGFMLPYTPLHQLLLQAIDFPIVMTSGNQSDVPQSIENKDALHKLEGIADFWLLHNRDIVNRVDDSVVRVIDGITRILRRARGYAPASFILPTGFEQAPELLAFGGELKNTFCMIKDGQAILSQHMGDLEDVSTNKDYQKNLKLYQHLFDLKPTALVIDAHPEYLSSKIGLKSAESLKLPLLKIQHHHAHIAACLAENNWPLSGSKVLGIALDGLGFGADGSLWGGEFMVADYYSYQRHASFKAVALLGGRKAMREPWRNTYSHLMAAMEWDELSTKYNDLELMSFLKQKPLTTLNTMLDKQLNTPLASSCGRLFDAVAGAIDICRNEVFYEGQAAMEMEALVTEQLLLEQEDSAYDFYIKTDAVQPYLETEKMWQSLLFDLQNKTSSNIIATRFHIGLAKGLCKMVHHICSAENNHKIDTVVISGGVFQNRVLFKQTSQQLKAAGFHILSHSQVPANDGGIALGQAVVALAQLLTVKG